VTKRERHNLLEIMNMAAACHQRIQYILHMKHNREQQESAWMDLCEKHNELAGAFQPLEEQLQIAMIENNPIVTKEEMNQSEMDELMASFESQIDSIDASVNKEPITDNVFNEELQQIQTPKDLLKYLNSDDGEESDEESFLDSGFKEKEENDDDIIIATEIKRRLNGWPSQNFGDTFEGMEKEKTVRDAVKTINLINKRIQQWRIYKDQNHIWKQFRD
jgi:hypothetical protein